MFKLTAEYRYSTCTRFFDYLCEGANVVIKQIENDAEYVLYYKRRFLLHLFNQIPFKQIDPAMFCFVFFIVFLVGGFIYIFSIDNKKYVFCMFNLHINFFFIFFNE